MKNPWVVIGVIAVVLFGGAFWYSSVVTEKNNEGVVVEAHVKGNPDAAVRLVEYSDFQCPACAAFQPVVEQVLASYGDSLAFDLFPLPKRKPRRSSKIPRKAATPIKIIIGR